MEYCRIRAFESISVFDLNFLVLAFIVWGVWRCLTYLSNSYYLIKYNNNILQLSYWLKCPLGAFATFLFPLIHVSTVSDRIWLPPPHTITAWMTQGYSPCIAVSIQSLNELSSLSIASFLLHPCKSIIDDRVYEVDDLKLELRLEEMYKFSTLPTLIW